MRGDVPSVDFSITKQARNIYVWLEIVVMASQPFNFVEDQIFNKYLKLEPVSRPTLMKYLQLVTKKVETEIQCILPEKFGLFVDGWTASGSGTHYLAIFAVYPRSGKTIPGTIRLAFSPLLDDTDFSPACQRDSIEYTLGVFKKTTAYLVFLTADKCSSKIKLAKYLGVPIVGCASHRFNLAVNKYLEPYSDQLSKINDLMKKLSSATKRGALQNSTDLAHVIMNTTRCSSTFSMLSRFFELKRFLDTEDVEIAFLLPLPGDLLSLNALLENLKAFEKATKMLQDEHINLHKVRVLFDKVLEQFPSLDHYLGVEEGSLTHGANFELAIVNSFSGKPLTTDQKQTLEQFISVQPGSTTEEVFIEERSDFVDEALKELEATLSANKLDWVSGTSNLAEKLFSHARFTLTHYHKKTLPINFESVVFIQINNIGMFAL